jgi:hypothetical protein
MRLSLDAWDGSRVSFADTEDPNLRQVLEAVGKLDGDMHTEVSLTRMDPFEYLVISGGPDDVLISGEVRGGTVLLYGNPDAPEGKIELVCGGQRGEFDLRDVVPKDRVRGAVEQFFAGLSTDLPPPWVF